jgi:hypothetical protein
MSLWVMGWRGVKAMAREYYLAHSLRVYGILGFGSSSVSSAKAIIKAWRSPTICFLTYGVLFTNISFLFFEADVRLQVFLFSLIVIILPFPAGSFNVLEDEMLRQGNVR